MSNPSNYIPLPWQRRMKTPEFLALRLADRMCLAVYLIHRYKALNITEDMPLNKLAFWHTHQRAKLFRLHVFFMQADLLYKQASVSTIGASQNVHTVTHQPRGH